MQIVIYSNLRKLSTLEGLIIEKHKEKEENRAKTLRNLRNLQVATLDIKNM